MNRLHTILLAVTVAGCAHRDVTPEPRPTYGAHAPAAAHCHATGTPQLPDHACTPGAVETTDLDVICHQSTKERRNVSTAEKRQVFAEYGIPWEDRASFEVDHLTPLCAGGSNEIGNLWPQPLAEAHVKDVYEEESKRRICAGTMTPKQAQEIFSSDWTAFPR